VPYLSASAVVIRYEEALYQVYCPFLSAKISGHGVNFRTFQDNLKFQEFHECQDNTKACTLIGDRENGV